MAVGAATLPADSGTVARFLAKCAPFDDAGHRWWLGAVDDGGYGRFQSGSGPAPVTTTAHRFADTLCSWVVERIAWLPLPWRHTGAEHVIHVARVVADIRGHCQVEQSDGSDQFEVQTDHDA